MAKTIDTLQALNALVASGVDENQAKAFVEVISEAGDDLATKSDLKVLETKLNILMTVNAAILGGIIIQFVFG